MAQEQFVKHFQILSEALGHREARETENELRRSLKEAETRERLARDDSKQILIQLAFAADESYQPHGCADNTVSHELQKLRGVFREMQHFLQAKPRELTSMTNRQSLFSVNSRSDRMRRPERRIRNPTKQRVLDQPELKKTTQDETGTYTSQAAG